MDVDLFQAEMFDSPEEALAFIGSVLGASTEYSIVATDLLGVILLWNEGARRLYGYEPEEIIGGHKSRLHIRADVVAGMPQAMMDRTLADGLWQGTVERERKDGSRFTARVVMTVRHSLEGSAVGFLLMSRDITAEQRLAALVESKAEQLALSLRYRSEFFSNMSHELRTPLNSLLILADVLRDNPEQNLTAKQISYAKAIHGSGTDLLRLLNDILQLAQTESGEITAEISDLALLDIQHILQRDFGRSADEKGLSFSIDLADDLPPTIATDPALLMRVLGLLVGNALKFTNDGAVSVSIHSADGSWVERHETLDTGVGAVAFDISDTGIGMSAEALRDVFDDFVQGDGTTSRQYSGAGLGLSIGRQLIRILDGDITVSSDPSHGSTFTVFLPITRRNVTATVPIAAPQ